MRVKRFIADDMRSALREVREELGADAVILSNRKISDQVEILAAMDYEENLINQPLGQSEVSAPAASVAAMAEHKPPAAGTYGASSHQAAGNQRR